MAVNVTTKGEKYLWNTCSLTWRNLPKTWSNAQKTFSTASVDESVRCLELDKRSVNYQRNHLANLKFSDNYSEKAKFKKSAKEVFSLSEAYWDNIAFALRILEQINLSERKQGKFNRPLVDGFCVFDLPQKKLTPLYDETFKLLDGFNRQAIFVMGVVENVKLDERHINETSYVRELGEDFGLTDKETCKSFFRPIYIESLRIGETYLDNIAFNLGIGENIGINEILGNKPVKPLIDKFGIADDERNIISKLYFEDLTIDEFIKTYRPIIRRFFEEFGIKETPMKFPAIAKAEMLGLHDEMIRACDSVLSDILIKSSGMSFEDFIKSIDSPPLYQSFVDFKVGEYEYEKAIVKLKLSTTSRESSPSIVGCVMHVDIPDTDDRGTVEITDVTQPTKVYFNKHYYTPPEVNVNLKNGNTLSGFVVPNIVSVNGIDGDGRYFEVELLDSNKNRATGTISWVSKGY